MMTRVEWKTPPRDSWHSCLLGYTVVYEEIRIDDQPTNKSYVRVAGDYVNQADNKNYFFEEEEGTNHSITLTGLKPKTNYSFKVFAFNPFGFNKDVDKKYVETLSGQEQNQVFINLYPASESFAK